jgi:hypothetical protein
MTAHQEDDLRPRRVDPRGAAQKAQQIAQVASALESRLSGVVLDAPLSTLREAAVTTHALAAQITGLLLDVIALTERLVVAAEMVAADERGEAHRRSNEAT